MTQQPAAAAGRASADEDGASPDQVKAELAGWVGQHWDPDMALRAWRELLLESGWAVPSWPRRWHGRGLPAWSDELVASELVRLGAVGIPVDELVDRELFSALEQVAQ